MPQHLKGWVRSSSKGLGGVEPQRAHLWAVLQHLCGSLSAQCFNQRHTTGIVRCGSWGRAASPTNLEEPQSVSPRTMGFPNQWCSPRFSSLKAVVMSISVYFLNEIIMCVPYEMKPLESIQASTSVVVQCAGSLWLNYSVSLLSVVPHSPLCLVATSAIQICFDS